MFASSVHPFIGACPPRGDGATREPSSEYPSGPLAVSDLLYTSAGEFLGAKSHNYPSTLATPREYIEGN